ncbi:hypothetical protein SAMN05421770_10890 [Granulicella rosea]|uniref:Uncharacterized protein n=1 Tax=Granulicella rosea TaxID=474952 RepID=A0A239LZE4_9BACT|nr:hypothetical protein SAMN05421770_10890 [Granulicella rosea]
MLVILNEVKDLLEAFVVAGSCSGQRRKTSNSSKNKSRSFGYAQDDRQLGLLASKR